MIVYSPEGIRSIDPLDVDHVYVDEADGSLYINATLCLRSGEEVSGRVLIAAPIRSLPDWTHHPHKQRRDRFKQHSTGQRGQHSDAPYLSNEHPQRTPAGKREP